IDGPVLDLDEMTPAWLSERLGEAGRDAVVSGVEWTQIGTGQIGRCYRATLEFSSRDPETPASLVVKLASVDPTSRATGVALRNYLREVRFYQHLTTTLSIRVPRCYYAAIEGEGPEFTLLLEDMSPAEQGDQLAGTTAAVAEVAVLELVGLHAPSWDRESLYEYEWLYHRPEIGADDSGALYNQHLPGFLDRYGPTLTAEQRQIIARYGELLGQEPAGYSGRRALVHIDYRLDNLLIDSSGPTPAVTVVDWQSITVGSPLGDVAYFLGAGLLPEHRRPIEEGIVRKYYDALQAAGVEDYTWSQCWDDYRLGTFAGFGVTVIASMIVERTERGDAMFTAMAQRHSQHALDHEADRLF
ncbi:MAG: phosphotransferase, partial [Pseudomonadota bacterium]